MNHPLRALALLLAIGCAPLAAQRQLEPSTPSGGNDWAITPELQAAVAKAHRWLAGQQHEAGYWTQHIGFKLNTDYRITKENAPHVGVTALALISFLAGGHVPGRGEFGAVTSRGLDYVLRTVQENGYVTENGTRMYSHAFATLFLAEVYGMTRRQDVKRALQKAVNLIVDSQNNEGGWRYKPFARESDMSVTVCQVLALRSARNVGIAVPASTIRAAETYVRRSAVRERGFNRNPYSWGGDLLGDGGAFRYQLTSNSRATFPLTAAGVTTLYAAGIYDDELVRRALDYLDSQMAIFNESYRHHYFFYYGHYYAVQAYYITGGNRWNVYFRNMRDHQLLPFQRADGSWPNDVGPGDAFATAIATLILQIPYQYLPIFQR
ncbi:MAG: prenyltransferase [Planctomycetes bacterium]|nr:prenyltransferase [Planctomycetota bacterium]